MAVEQTVEQGVERELEDGAVEAGSEHHDRRWIALLILSLSLMLVIMDGTIVNVAIPSITQDFNSTFRDAEWVNTVYSLVFAATLILWGKIGDQYGRRRLFLMGVVLFGVGSALVGASSSVGMLVAMRALQGLGAAILSPSTLSIVTTTFRGRERGIAFGVWGATAGVAAALGPLLGGWVVDHASWRWAFYINIPIVILAFIGALWAIRESRDPASRRYFDVTGTLLGGLGLGGLVFGIIEGQTYGWWKPTEDFSVLGVAWPFESFSIVPFSIIGGLILLAIFTWYERRLERAGVEPIFEFSLLRFRSYRFGMIIGMIVNLGEIGVLFAVSLFLQGTKGLSAFDTGLALLPLAGAAFFAAPFAGSFSSRLGPKWIVTAGMVIEAIALLILSQIIDVDVRVTSVAAVLGLYGLGLGLAIAQLTNLVLFDIPAPKAGIASGGNSTIRQVGSALGIAIIGTVLTTTTATRFKEDFAASPVLAESPIAAMQPVWIEMAKQPVNFDFVEVLEAGMSGGDESGEGRPSALAQLFASMDLAPQGEALNQVVLDARSEGMARAALAGCAFIAVGALSSLALPNPREGARAPVAARAAPKEAAAR
ncbi:MAG: MFS transporter [Chloroflexota bacterium]|nr:MFS transporter [Anaerolineae bacterium]